LEKALLWLRYQDSNECGLLEVHEAMDWADLFANRYNVLYDNALYYAAWKCMGQLAQALARDREFYFQNARDVRKKMNMLLWVGPEEPKDWEWIHRERKEWLYPLSRVETELVIRPFYLPYMAFRDYADRFDTLGNLLAILFGIADETKTNRILDYIHGVGLNQPFPVRCLYPVLNPGDKDWREYYRVRNLNQPHHYHNGGAWSSIGGFYVAARQVRAFGRVLAPARVTKTGTAFEITQPDFALLAVEMANGTLVQRATSYYVSSRTKQAYAVEFHGHLGSLNLANWVSFGAVLEFAEFDKD
jgi:hypothetical protein